jgi:hypothetical protein
MSQPSSEQNKHGLVCEIQIAEQQLTEGQGVPHEQARLRVLEALRSAVRFNSQFKLLGRKGRGDRLD